MALLMGDLLPLPTDAESDGIVAQAGRLVLQPPEAEEIRTIETAKRWQQGLHEVHFTLAVGLEHFLPRCFGLSYNICVLWQHAE